MQNSKLHFEQVPLELVKKRLEQRSQKKEKATSGKFYPGSCASRLDGTVKMAVATEIHDGWEHPEWQRPVHEALVELDMEKLKVRVAAAEAAIFQRLQALSQIPDHSNERQALSDAVASLRVVKRETLAFPE
jgi:hypothetical protein